MLFIETSVFTKRLAEYLTDDKYGLLQAALVEKPDLGKLIQGTGGLRKLRWSLENRGKRGGLRIIYYWQVQKDQIYFMTIYAKNEISDLSAKEKIALRQILERWQV